MDFKELKLPPYITVANAEIIYEISGRNMRDRLIRGTLEGFKVDPTLSNSPWLVSTESLDKNYKRRVNIEKL